MGMDSGPAPKTTSGLTYMASHSMTSMFELQLEVIASILFTNHLPSLIRYIYLSLHHPTEDTEVSALPVQCSRML